MGLKQTKNFRTQMNMLIQPGVLTIWKHIANKHSQNLNNLDKIYVFLKNTAPFLINASLLSNVTNSIRLFSLQWHSD